MSHYILAVQTIIDYAVILQKKRMFSFYDSTDQSFVKQNMTCITLINNMQEICDDLINIIFHGEYQVYNMKHKYCFLCFILGAFQGVRKW